MRKGDGGEDAVAWTASELSILRQSIRENGLENWETLGDWSQVASAVGGGKTAEQCFNRWHAEYNERAALERHQQQQQQQHRLQHHQQAQGHPHPPGGRAGCGIEYHPHLYQHYPPPGQQQHLPQRERYQHTQPRSESTAPRQHFHEQHHQQPQQQRRAPASEYHHAHPGGHPHGAAAAPSRAGGASAEAGAAGAAAGAAGAARAARADPKYPSSSASSSSGGYVYDYRPSREGAAFGSRPYPREPDVQPSMSLSGWQPIGPRGGSFGFGNADGGGGGSGRSWTGGRGGGGARGESAMIGGRGEHPLRNLALLAKAASEEEEEEDEDEG